MAKESRDAVISVRISEEDQQRLRELAAARGTSVSELVRGIVLREISDPPAAGPTVTAAQCRPQRLPTTGAGTRAPSADQGIFWGEHGHATVAGSTITVRYS